MTTTAPAPEAAAELAPVSAARKALAKKGRKLADIVRAVHTSRRATPQATEIEVAPQAPLPVKPTIGEDVRVALRLVADKVALVKLPTKRQKLSAAQFETAGEALKLIKAVKKWIKELEEETFRPAFFNHFDLVAESTPGFDPTLVETDKHGFYVLAASVKLDSGVEVKREPRRGTPVLTAEALEELVKAGKLSRDRYLKMTTPVRVINEDVTLALLEKDPSLALVLREASTVGTASASLNLR